MCSLGKFKVLMTFKVSANLLLFSYSLAFENS